MREKGHEGEVSWRGDWEEGGEGVEKGHERPEWDVPTCVLRPRSAPPLIKVHSAAAAVRDAWEEGVPLARQWPCNRYQVPGEKVGAVQSRCGGVAWRW